MNRAADTTAPGGTGESAAAPDASSLIAALQAHRRAPRGQSGYWDQYCVLIRTLCRASAVLLVAPDGAGWRKLGEHSEDDDWAARHWEAVVRERAGRKLDKGFAFTPLQDEAGRLRILALVQTTGIGEALLVIDIPQRERAQLNELLMRAMLIADFSAPDGADPADHAAMAAELEDDAGSGAGTGAHPGAALALAAPAGGGTSGSGIELAMLDLVTQVMAEPRFGGAALVLVNGLAARLGAAQVALGWRQHGAMRTVAVSHVDRFEHNTDNVQLLDQAFLEALGESGPVWYSAGNAEDARLPAHAKLARLLGFDQLFALPLQEPDGSAGALLLFAFQGAPRTAPAAADLALPMGVLQPWLQQLRQRDRWWGARLRDAAGQFLARWLGPGHVWRRSAVIVASLLLLFVLFGRWEYQVEASAQLTTDSTRLISAQFDGRIDAVQASAGDTVHAGDKLASLDTRELRQQQLDLSAERQRLEAESDKARAANNLADLGIAQARSAQAEARLARIGQYLAQAQAVAPFDGVIVAGERKDLLNAPVKKGDNMFRIARIDGLYVDIMVPERDVRFIKPNARGELRLLSRPDQTIPFTLSTVIPMAQVKGQEGVHFLVKGKFDQAPEAWWRPGMSGIAELDGGKQNISWILTHRLLDKLRMKLWWIG
ncbi:MAG: efflux RND transporter periplasmic adaptor subunit [Massilia sp.]